MNNENNTYVLLPVFGIQFHRKANIHKQLVESRMV